MNSSDVTRPSYQLRLHGRTELRTSQGTVVPFATRNSLLILALLCLGPAEGLLRASLASTVWESAAPDAARAGLRTALVGLRTSLPDVILTDRDFVRLAPGAIEVDGEDAGDFMPEFETAWVIDERLRRRAVAIDSALTAARVATDLQAALEWAERACAIDPLNAEAVDLRTSLLESLGRKADAITTGNVFRARVLREFGTFSTPPARVAEEADPTRNPLVVAAEYTLDRDPSAACALLAGTQSQWFSLCVATALDVHERVLAALTKESRERTLVEAGRYSLLVLNGKLRESLSSAETAYRRALDDGDLQIAVRLADTLAYGNLSAGNFSKALLFAREGLDSARQRNDVAGIAEAEMMRSIIDLHTGRVDAANRRIEKAYSLIDSLESPYLIASFQNVYAGSLIAQGRVAQSLPIYEACRRRADALGSDRLRVWVGFLESLLYERTGDLPAARTALMNLQKIAPAAGQAAIASVEDALLRINCALREFDQAAEALARSDIYRGRVGTVPSILERKDRRAALGLLRERMGTNGLATTIRRVASATGRPT